MSNLRIKECDYLKNNYDTDIDVLLVKVMTHEYSKCVNFFWQFANLSAKDLFEEESRNKQLNIATYNAYSLFIHYLYEFLIACYKRDVKPTSDFDYKITDSWINDQVNRILSKWLMQIDNDYAPSWANARCYYDEKCPQNFSSHFRTIRNNTVHTDYRRLVPEKRISLSEFSLALHRNMK